MTIVERLRALIKARGGDPTGLMTVEACVAAPEAIELAANPLSALTIDVDVAADENLLGKVIADLQEDIVIGPHSISGTLHYIDDYTQFGAPEEQEGHYLCLHASVPDVTGATIEFKHSCKSGEVYLDADGLIIMRVDDSYPEQDVTITFTASKSGNADFSKTYDLKGIVLAPAAE